MNNFNDIINTGPDSIREAITTHKSEKIAQVATGLNDFTVESVAQYFGTKIASRNQKWRSVADGLLSLALLRRG
jgi:hypothetical protein